MIDNLYSHLCSFDEFCSIDLLSFKTIFLMIYSRFYEICLGHMWFQEFIVKQLMILFSGFYSYFFSKAQYYEKKAYWKD